MKKLRILDSNEFNIRFSVFEIATLFVVFLATMNFANRYFYFIWIALPILLIFCRRSVSFNLPFCSLLLLAFSILVFSGESFDRITELLKPFTYPISYILGSSLLRSNKTENLLSKELRLKIFFIICAVSGLVHIILNWSINSNSSSRNTVDYWTNSVLSATGQAAIACLIIGCSCAFLFSREKLIYKIASIVALLTVLGYNLILSGRTIVLFTIITLLVACLHYVFSKGNTKKFRILLFAGLFVVVAVIFYSYNIFDIRDTIENSNFYNRLFEENSIDSGADKRLSYKIRYLNNLINYPFGGGNIRNEIGKYAHDLFLDTYDYAGVFAFLAVAIYILLSVLNVIKILKSPNIKFITKQLVVCVYLVLFMEFMIEPILLGLPWLFATFCFIDGAVWGLLRTEVEQCA